MLQNITSRGRRALALASVAALTAPAAFAQDTGVDTLSGIGVEAINNLKATGTLYITAAFGVAILCAGGFWAIKIMKKSFGAAK